MSEAKSEAKNEIARRDTVLAMYYPIRNPTNKKPMLQLRSHGECTTTDNRVCWNHYTVEPLFCCALFVPISLEKFHALTLDSIIKNGIMVVLHDWHDDVYAAHQAINPSGKDQKSGTIEELLADARNATGTSCNRGVDILSTPFEFVQYQGSKATKRTLGNKLYERKEWNKFVRRRTLDFYCDRTTVLNSKLPLQRVSGRTAAATSCKTKADPIRQEPILVVEGRYMLRSRFGKRSSES